MTVGVPALAAGFASQFDTIGPYIGFGSLIAVIAMAVLVFSQGRELQRLRDLAGTAPERLKALEDRLEREQRLLTGPARPATPALSKEAISFIIAAAALMQRVPTVLQPARIG